MKRSLGQYLQSTPCTASCTYRFCLTGTHTWSQALISVLYFMKNWLTSFAQEFVLNKKENVVYGQLSLPRIIRGQFYKNRASNLNTAKYLHIWHGKVNSSVIISAGSVPKAKQKHQRAFSILSACNQLPAPSGTGHILLRSSSNAQ